MALRIRHHSRAKVLQPGKDSVTCLAPDFLIDLASGVQAPTLIIQADYVY